MESNNLSNQLYTELFRPKRIDAAILLPRVREVVSKGIQNNMLFAGIQGTGKTTICRILCQGYDTFEINGSMDNGIDTFRDDVQMFVSSSSLMDGERKMKIVLIEECDGLSQQAWNSLRNFIEKYHKTVRFIANCNYIEKIPAPILSRMDVIDLAPINKEEEDYLINEYENRVKKILTYLKISYTDENVTKFVKNNYPDMRSIVKKIQQLHTRGCTELTQDMLAASFDASSLFEMILGTPDPWNNYKALVSDWSNKVEDAMLQISEKLPEYIHTARPDKDNKIPSCVITTAEHFNMLGNSIDKFIVLESLVFKLQYIINS